MYVCMCVYIHRHTVSAYVHIECSELNDDLCHAMMSDTLHKGGRRGMGVISRLYLPIPELQWQEHARPQVPK